MPGTTNQATHHSISSLKSPQSILNTLYIKILDFSFILTKKKHPNYIVFINIFFSDLLVDKEKGYKEWLEESAQLHEGAHLHLQAEIEAEEDLLKSVGSSKEDSDKSVPVLALNSKASKAARYDIFLRIYLKKNWVDGF